MIPWKSGKITIDLGYDCNHKCVYCYNKHIKVPKNLSFSSDQLIHLMEYVNNIVGNKYLHYQITGGEPTIYPELLDALLNKYITLSHHTSLGINTNLTLDISMLIDTYLKRTFTINVSLPSTNKEHFNKITGSLLTYDKLMNNLLKLIQSGFQPSDISINIIVVDINESSIGTTVSDLIYVGLKNIYITNPLGYEINVDFKNLYNDVEKFALNNGVFLKGNRVCTAACLPGVSSVSNACVDRSHFILKLLPNGQVKPCSCGFTQPVIGYLSDGFENLLKARDEYMNQKEKPFIECNNCRLWNISCMGACLPKQ